MSTTAGQMIDEIRRLLRFGNQEQVTTLTQTMGSADASFSVPPARGIATGISAGLVEIDSELLFVEKVGTDGVATVTPWGRGYESTTAAAHFAGARVVSQPAFPRAKVLDTVNDVLGRIYPSVFAVKQVETTTTYPRITYALPSDAERVLSAKWLVPGGDEYWRDVRRMRMSPGLGTQFGDAGRTVDVADAMMPGRPLQILYAARPAPLAAETDVFETVTGLASSIKDVVTIGAAAGALTISQELSRLQTSSIEQQNRSQLVAPSAALTSSRFLDQRFQERLAEEHRSLLELFPPRITRSWR